MSHVRKPLLFPNTPQIKYPHLAGDDIPVWHKFITDHGRLFQGFEYDHHTGIGIPAHKDHEPEIEKMRLNLTQKRIDVLGFANGTLWVIEVKGRAGLSVIGQVLGYETLLKAEGSFTIPMLPVVVAGIIEPDIETVLNDRGILFYDVSDDHNNLLTPSGQLVN